MNAALNIWNLKLVGDRTKKKYRIDLHIMKNANRNVAENREVLCVVIEIIIFIACQNIALRGLQTIEVIF